ncbi:ABC transporter ATP-binding protein [Cryptosporangium sp. NPDC048952]|uniref:ABC transporter ATP-binding protein n=1 Tax=Cryptosporangium sp. NPDC048952 TaxID=3363961 RepID=UPI003716A9B8
MNLVLSDVSKTYTPKRAPAHTAVSDVSLTVEPGEFVSVVGPSGCGKSTLLMMVAGLLSPSSGAISLGGAAVSGPPEGVGVVFQDYSRSLYPWMSVAKNLELATSAYRLSREDTRSRVEEALHAVGLGDVGKSYPWQMSGGMQQRVAIARALVVRPQVMLMDEPLAAVDAQTRADLEDLVLRVRDDYGMTVVIVTHDIDEAVYLGDRVLVMQAKPGRIVEDIRVELPRPRDQVTTKADPLFAELRGRIYRQIMRPAAA